MSGGTDPRHYPGGGIAKGLDSMSVREATALEKQEGGQHYKGMKIQPVEYCMANGLDACESGVIKYISRHRNKGKIEDLRKARHYLELEAQLVYGEKL